MKRKNSVKIISGLTALGLVISMVSPAVCKTDKLSMTDNLEVEEFYIKADCETCQVEVEDVDEGYDDTEDNDEPRVIELREEDDPYEEPVIEFIEEETEEALEGEEVTDIENGQGVVLD